MWIRTNNFREELSKASRVFQFSGLQYFTLNDGNEVNHHGEKISRKFRLTFGAALMTIVLYEIAYTAYYLLNRSWMNSERFENENFNSGVIMQEVVIVTIVCLLLLTVIHAYTSTSKAKQIFKLCEENCEILQSQFKFHVKISVFSSRFRKILVASTSFLLTKSLIYGIFVYYLEVSRLVPFSFTVLPFLFMLITLLRVLFYLLLINFNLEAIKLVLEQSERKITFPVDFSLKYFMALQNIYVKIWETTELANDICGPYLCSLLVLSVIGNTLVGYQIFLFTKGEINGQKAFRELKLYTKFWLWLTYSFQILQTCCFWSMQPSY